MKADRLLSAILLLQAHGRLSTRVLSERLEVSQRTAHRDMEALAAAGVPVFALRGAHGGWQLDDGWRVRVPGFAASIRAWCRAPAGRLGGRSRRRRPHHPQRGLRRRESRDVCRAGAGASRRGDRATGAARARGGGDCRDVQAVAMIRSSSRAGLARTLSPMPSCRPIDARPAP
ncbi:MAG: HTH domain-containing protein [Acidobacteria bacterium]|nr:HTH domain-containing protein [Acidobacteriota bacterium]